MPLKLMDTACGAHRCLHVMIQWTADEYTFLLSLFGGCPSRAEITYRKLMSYARQVFGALEW